MLKHMGLAARIRMVSGKEHTFVAVLMFDVNEIRRAELIRQQIERNAAGFQSGLFFIGSLTSVVTSAALLGLAEGAVSNQMRGQAVRQLEDYYQACIQVRNSGQWIELNQIDNIRVPVPALWRAIGNPQTSRGGYLLFNDPCVAIKTPQDESLSVMWDKVEDFRLEFSGSPIMPPPIVGPPL